MIVYLAHPVGHGEDRTQNLENVQKWFLWLFHHTDWTINVPWFIYVSNLDETHRKRALRDDLIVLNTCEGICLTGGKISGGMQTELGLAQVYGNQVFDLTSLGFAPPDSAEADAKALALLGLA